MSKRIYSKPVFFEIHHRAVEELAAIHYRHAAERWRKRARSITREVSKNGFWRGQDRRYG